MLDNIYDQTRQRIDQARQAGENADALRAAGVKPGTRRTTGAGGRDYRYIGIVRVGRTVIVECGHEHANRDWPRSGDPGATGCARDIIDGAANPALAERRATKRARAWENLTRSTGFTTPAGTIAAAKTTAAADAAAYLATVDTVRAALADALPANHTTLF